MKNIINKQKEFYNSNITKDVKFRITNLHKLKHAINTFEKEIYEALNKDLNKSEIESYLTEIQIVIQEINYAIKNLKKWHKQKKVSTPITNPFSTSYIYNEPYGTVLILSPWNYPFQLALAPLVGAIAGGNTAILKVSKSSENVSNILRKIINETFEDEYIYCASESYSYDEILNQKYDLIFFTGSKNIGQKIMEQASKNLTPVILELGGKSPCIIDKSANIKMAAKRIIFGKLLNSGQTCIAPDYVLVNEDVKDEVIKELKNQIKKMYQNPLTNPNYPKIINEHHFNRLITLVNNYANKVGGNYDIEAKRIEPTLFLEAKFEDEIMQDEIFGPILPIISYTVVDDIIRKIKERDKPLALYLFTEDKTMSNKIINSIEFGGGCINDVIMHIANHHLPFGGVESSGMGSYHGYFSYKTFTREKGILKNSTKLDLPLRYPPYTNFGFKLIKRITK